MDRSLQVISRFPQIESIIRDNESILHPGLLFQRFAKIFEPSKKNSAHLDQHRHTRLELFSNTFEKCRDTIKRRLAHVNDRFSKLTSAGNGEEKEYITDGRLAIGLGNADPSDIGFHFDHDIGLPTIPGPSVKGLTRAGARLAGVDDETIIRYFGYQGKEGESSINDSIGQVIFLSALPVNVPKFEIDIITCHHNFEQLEKQKTPLDCDNPIPVHFLTVRQGTSFTFRIIPRIQQSDINLDLVWSWLSLALEYLGAGGKTAVGYGSLVSIDRDEQVAAIQSAVASSQRDRSPSFKRGDKVKVRRIDDPKGKNREVFEVPGGYKGFLKSGSTNTEIGDETELYIYSIIKAQRVITFALEPV